jgi:hypothetical protein
MFQHKHALYASTSLAKCDDWDDAGTNVFVGFDDVPLCRFFLTSRQCAHVSKFKKNQGLFCFVSEFFPFLFVSIRFSNPDF